MSSNQFDKKSEAWSALFSEPMSELVKRYTASVGFDQRMWKANRTALQDLPSTHFEEIARKTAAAGL